MQTSRVVFFYSNKVWRKLLFLYGNNSWLSFECKNDALHRTFVASCVIYKRIQVQMRALN